MQASAHVTSQTAGITLSGFFVLGKVGVREPRLAEEQSREKCSLLFSPTSFGFSSETVV
jgi:hypothetical protein